jgi:uncharacterized membrane protein
MNRSTNPRKFLREDESARLTEAVAAAERATAAEVKVVLVRRCWGGIRRKAARVFRKLGLHKTEQRNCVMILLALAGREFLIFGDRGIHERVGQGFWNDVRDLMAERFGSDEFGIGLCEAVRRVGEKLAEHFPHQADDRNEIPDEPAYED